MSGYAGRTGCWWGSCRRRRALPRGRRRLGVVCLLHVLGGCTGPAEPFSPTGAGHRGQGVGDHAGVGPGRPAGRRARGPRGRHRRRLHAGLQRLAAQGHLRRPVLRARQPAGPGHHRSRRRARRPQARRTLHLRGSGVAPPTTASTWTGMRQGYWEDSNPTRQQYGAAGLPGTRYRCADRTSTSRWPQRRVVRARSSRPSPRTRPSSTEVLHEDWYTPDDAATLERSGAELALVFTVSSTYYRTRYAGR